MGRFSGGFAVDFYNTQTSQKQQTPHLAEFM